MKLGGYFDARTALFDRSFEQVFSISSLCCAGMTIDFTTPITVRTAWFPPQGALAARWHILSDIASGQGAVLDEAWEVFCGLAEDEFADAAAIVEQIRSSEPPYDDLTVEMAQRAVELLKRVKSVTRDTA